jgi:hypothetical protein
VCLPRIVTDPKVTCRPIMPFSTLFSSSNGPLKGDNGLIRTSTHHHAQGSAELFGPSEEGTPKAHILSTVEMSGELSKVSAECRSSD